MPTTPKRREALESFSRMPGHLVRRVHQVSTAHFSDACGGELTPVQYAALVAIGSHPGIDATRLSHIIRFDRSTIGDVLDRIEAKGWVVREGTAADRRVKRLTLLPAGRAVLRQVEPAIRDVQVRLLAPLTAAEARTFVTLLTKVADGIDGAKSAGNGDEDNDA